MSTEFPILNIYLGILGFGLSILFCTTFCRLCQRIRQDRIEREEEQNSERNGPSIYFIPFSRRLSQQDSEDEFFGPRGSQEPGSPPQYNSVYNESPPPYNELEHKLEDLPPAYTEYSVPTYPITPPPPTDVVQPQTQLQQ